MTQLALDAKVVHALRALNGEVSFDAEGIERLCYNSEFRRNSAAADCQRISDSEKYMGSAPSRANITAEEGRKILSIMTAPP